MITLQLDPACQLCDQFKEDINKSMVVVYGDFEEEKRVTDFCITCAHRKVCAILSSKCEQAVNALAYKNAHIGFRDNAGQFHGTRKNMGTLKFRFVDGESVLYYETDGTDDGTYLYYCLLEDCAMCHDFVKNNRCIDSWFGLGLIVRKGESASDYFKLLVREDREMGGKRWF